MNYFSREYAAQTQFYDIASFHLPNNPYKNNFNASVVVRVYTKRNNSEQLRLLRNTTQHRP